MYELGDKLAYFNGASIFLEITAQHATREKEETIYCPSKVCNNNVMYCIKIVKLYADTWFGVVSWIITSSEASTVRHNQGQKAS
jgi:hypothetical protein